MQEKILRGLRSEDPNIQKQVYYEHCDRLMEVVYGYLRSLSDAEEVLQDTFLTIFGKIDRFDPKKGSFEAWTHRIAVNNSLMVLRKKKRLTFTDADLHQLPSMDGRSSMAAKWEQAELDRLLAKLSHKEAIVFRLKVLEGFNHQEIADLLKIKNDASRTLFSRARKKLRQYFAGPEGAY